MMILNDEIVGMWKECVVACFKSLQLRVGRGKVKGCSLLKHCTLKAYGDWSYNSTYY
jgi:hypothetical protein